MTHRRSLLALFASLLLLLPVACGASSETTASSATSRTTASAFPLTITDDDGVKVTLDHTPQRIVTFAPSMTETVFALGAGARLVGVSGAFDDYPPAAKQIQQIGGAGDFGVDPNIETVVSLQPDLFLTIEGGDEWKQRLRDLGVPVVTLNATDFPDLLHDIGTVGQLLGETQAAAALTEQMQTAEDQVAQQVAATGRATCFFEVYDPPLTTVGPHTFIYDLLERAGCDPVSSSAKTDYPKWSVDELVASSPDVYLATPESVKSIASLQRRPGFDGITAIAEGHVGLIDADLVTRPGPRVVQGLQELADALHGSGTTT